MCGFALCALTSSDHSRLESEKACLRVRTLTGLFILHCGPCLTRLLLLCLFKDSNWAIAVLKLLNWTERFIFNVRITNDKAGFESCLLIKFWYPAWFLRCYTDLLDSLRSALAALCLYLSNAPAARLLWTSTLSRFRFRSCSCWLFSDFYWLF